MMGVEWADCPMVAEMVGMKFFTNEFVAYQQLSQYKNKRLSGVEEWIEGKKQWISVSASLEKHKQSVDTPKKHLAQEIVPEAMAAVDTFIPIEDLPSDNQEIPAELIGKFNTPKTDNVSAKPQHNKSHQQASQAQQNNENQEDRKSVV